MNLLTFLYIVIGVLLNACAQLLLKAGTNALGILFFEKISIFNQLIRIILEPHILSGLVCYGFSVCIWIVALSKTPVSIAYPMLSIGYIFNLLAAWYFLGEELSIQKIVGITIIILGVLIISRT